MKESTVRRLLQSTYVDDVVTGAGSDTEAFELYSDSKSIFRQGGFNLRKFQTNSLSLQKQIDVAEAVPESTKTSRTQAKVLGVPWRPDNNTLEFELSTLSAIAEDLQPTKQNVVSLVGRFYDPLGYLSPVTIRFKILFQKLCRFEVDWDVDLPDELLKEWRSLLAEGIPISLPRCYTSRHEGTSATYTLCGFCDASTQAYAAVVYLITESDSGTEVCFVVSKTRVAPIQSQTVPRLELLSALLLSRLIKSVADSLSDTLPPLSLKCYTDSQVALFWILGITKEWKPFVNNRVQEIRSLVPVECWKHCPGSTNPADLPSRGLYALELAVNQLWRQGPEWLQTSFDPVPLSSDRDMPEECAVEMKKDQSHCLVVTGPSLDLESVFNLSKYSTFHRLIQVTATVLSAVERFKSRKGKGLQAANADMLQKAELLWMKSAQMKLAD